MTIGERVKELIVERGMTQKQFSERTGIPQSTISDWKSKKLNPASDKIAIICEVLEIDPSLLLSGSSGIKYESESVLHINKGTSEYELLSVYQTLNRRFQDRLIAYAYAYALADLQKSDTQQNTGK